MSAPKRIQRKRVKGWRMPDGAIYVGRPTRWGNPFVIHDHDGCGDDLHLCPLHEDAVPVLSVGEAVRRFDFMLHYPVSGEPRYPDADEIRYHLAGHDLACWCPLDAPCHADVLLELANR